MCIKCFSYILAMGLFFPALDLHFSAEVSPRLTKVCQLALAHPCCAAWCISHNRADPPLTLSREMDRAAYFAAQDLGWVGQRQGTSSCLLLTQ